MLNKITLGKSVEEKTLGDYVNEMHTHLPKYVIESMVYKHIFGEYTA